MLGLVLAVLTERVRWATAFKLVLFMPMAVSFLAAGIIFRLVYDEDPDKGVAERDRGRRRTTPSRAAPPTRAPARVTARRPAVAGGRLRYRDRAPPARATPSPSAWSACTPGDLPAAEPAQAAAAAGPADELAASSTWTSPPAAAASRARSTRPRTACPG